MTPEIDPAAVAAPETVVTPVAPAAQPAPASTAVTAPEPATPVTAVAAGAEPEVEPEDADKPKTVAYSDFRTVKRQLTKANATIEEHSDTIATLSAERDELKEQIVALNNGRKSDTNTESLKRLAADRFVDIEDVIDRAGDDLLAWEKDEDIAKFLDELAEKKPHYLVKPGMRRKIGAVTAPTSETGVAPVVDPTVDASGQKRDPAMVALGQSLATLFGANGAQQSRK